MVFSDETLENIEAAEPESFREVRDNFAYWDRIESYHGGTCVTSVGHGFCGLSRKKLRMILQERCQQLGVRMEFESEIVDLEQFADADLILAAGRADLCCLARPHLVDPYLTLHAAEKYGWEDQSWPGQYLLGRGLKGD